MHGISRPRVCGAHLIVVNINLEEHNIRQLLAELLESRSDLLARRTPGCREIDAYEGVPAVCKNFFKLRLRGDLLYLSTVAITLISQHRSRAVQGHVSRGHWRSKKWTLNILGQVH